MGKNPDPEFGINIPDLQHSKTVKIVLIRSIKQLQTVTYDTDTNF
jgi:hypothetical protein